MKDVLKNLKSFTRLILIVGVMTGLFFSGGEGIQFLPFPETASQTEKDASQIHSGKSKSYAFSVNNSNIHSGTVKSKSQKNLKFFDLADVVKNRRQTTEFLSLAVNPNYYRAAISVSTDIFVSPSDRAPPIV
ncbi:MAG TPA: hypothetical protein PKY59_26605 [Pyrinomonadaceae bacterium]|nr:hypothetical protein [Pyrinomonadaceae bacterium]